MVTNYGEGRGATKQEGGGGASEILPLQKGRADIILAMLKAGGGGTKCSEVVSTQELEVLAILMGEGGRCKKFPPFQNGGGREKFYPVLILCIFYSLYLFDEFETVFHHFKTLNLNT